MEKEAEKKYRAEKLRELVLQNDDRGVEIYLDGGHAVIWRDVIRYEHSISEMLETALKDDPLVPQLLQFEIQGLSSLHLAAVLDHREVLGCLLSKEMPVDTPLGSGTTVLHLAAFMGHLELVRALLSEYKADIAKTDGYGWTALHYASIGGHRHVAEFLVSHGIDVTVRDKDGTTAAFRAKDANHQEIVELLLQHGVEDELLQVEENSSSWTKEPLTDYYSLPHKMNKSASQQELVSPSGSKQRRPPPVPRQTSLPATTSTPGGHNESPDSQTYPRLRAKQEHQEKVRKEIRRQLSLAFASDYELPVTQQSHRIKNEGSGNTSIGVGLGLKTLKGLLREEFEKFKQEEMINKILNDMSNIGDDEDDYETLPGSDALDEPPAEEAPGRPLEITNARKAPRLPPRNSMQPQDQCVHLDKQKSNTAVLNYVFKRIAPTLGTNWKKLAKELNLGKRIQFIENKYTKDPEKQAMVTLGEWRIDQGPNADIDDLIIALRKCKLNEVLSKLETVCQEITA